MNEQQPHTGNGKLKRDLGLWAATAIVIGNMIGSGIFTAPQSLAAASNPTSSIIAWLITSVGSLFLALVFGKLGALYPRSGGPIVYTRLAYGEFAAFLIAWTFWIGMWVGNAAIITAVVRYLTIFFPALGTNGLLAFIVSSSILWLFTLINLKGVKEAGFVGIVTTVAKISVLIVVIAVAFWGFSFDNFYTVSAAELSGFGSIPVAVAITLWSYIGLESASVTGGEIKNPARNIKLSTILGFSITAVIYILTSFAAMGAMPQSELANSTAPMSDIINRISGGTWGGWFMALGVIVAAGGATSGWILTTARSSFAAGEEKLFPSFFARVHKRYSTPSVSLIVSGVLANVLLSLNYVLSLTDAFNFMILLATLAFLPAYSFSAAAQILLTNTEEKSWRKLLKASIIPLLAFIYCVYTTYAAGAEVAMYTFILMLLGIPVFVVMRLQNRR
ncbi:amino acid permease [Acetobacteroides hydrogenigenes]|uniref:Arginine/agmatine antiporter n=1 Tax=Acetobacteroides hydrogenigenes TaxID=979970 RepID=A0A4R2EGW0_9BACT|nr:amino acid permease [Acetobacteroides hydrogenigenes]TCN67631.1 amino acid transporter [Acetobacteroides hydrogenigenes]